MFFFHHRRTPDTRPFGTEPQAILGRLFPFRQPDSGGFRRDSDRSLLVQGLHWNTPQSRLEAAPHVHEPSGVQAAAWARLDNRPELAEKLRITPAELPCHSDTHLILLSYLAWGEDCVEHLVGDYAFVIHDPKRNAVFCGRDPMGPRPLYYFASDSTFACATSLSALNPLDGTFLEIDPQWIAEYALQLSMSFDRTPYPHVRKLPPGHCLLITPGQIRLRQYFRLSAEPELKLRDSREYVDAYRTQLEEAIRCRLVSEHPIGSELSGGVDSSTITAFAARLMDHPEARLHTFGYAFLEMEAEHIRAVHEGCGLARAHIYTEPSLFRRNAPDRFPFLLGYPAEHGNACFHEPFYEDAEKLGIRTLLSGFGGDEFGTTIHGYLVPMGLAVQGRYRELMRILPGNAFARFLRTVKLDLRRRRTSNFTQVPSGGMFEAFQKRWPHRIVREEWVQRANLEARFLHEGRFDMGYSDLKTFTLERRWAPFVPTRMENCSLMAAGRGVEYRWPLLDVRLVRLFLSIPAEENYHRGMGRYLHRRAIHGVVPDMVAWKPSKCMGSPLYSRSELIPDALPSRIDDLHPVLANHLDFQLLQHQMDQFPDLLKEDRDERSFQFKHNIRSAYYLSAWLKRLDAMGGAQ